MITETQQMPGKSHSTGCTFYNIGEGRSCVSSEKEGCPNAFGFPYDHLYCGETFQKEFKRRMEDKK